MGVLSARPSNRTHNIKGNNMKTNRYTYALVAGGLLATAAAVVGIRMIGIDGVFGFAAVGAVLVLAASDYLGGRKLFSR